jgi:DNA-binding NtrC family response regulator
MRDAVPIAIIDDDEEMLRVVAKYLQKHGHTPTLFSDPRKALNAFAAERFGVVISDVQMPGMSGLEILERAKAALPGAVVIMITGFGSVAAAVSAMKQGAFDYISKPFNYDEFLVVLEKACAQYRLQREVTELRRSVRDRYSFGAIIGHSPSMRQVMDVLARVAPTNSNVLLEGASGTGKELLARALHFAGPRKAAPFVAINCGGLPETLLDSELFGHERGAYTGATSQERGLLASADTGTVYLDEIADMPVAMQTKLLRVLEDWEVRPVGGSVSRKIDVRVISSSKIPLADAVERGTFREDLYYRLNVVTIRIPPLRERSEDIPLLINAILARKSGDGGEARIDRDALDALLRYDWPGNVRELEHALERALVLCADRTITLADLPPVVAEVARAGAAGRPSGSDASTLEDVERAHITAVLARVQWNRSLAADLLGINRRTLYRKIQEYGISETRP